MTYLVTIFDYVYDSAGNHIMAADVAWSYNTAMAVGKMRPLGDIESVTATGDYTVEFVFKKALGPGGLDKLLIRVPHRQPEPLKPARTSLQPSRLPPALTY